MSNTGTPRDDAELKVFLGRESPVSEAYAAIEPVMPPEVLDGKVLALARSALTAAAAKSPPAPQPAVPAGTSNLASPSPPVSPPAPPAARPVPRAVRVEVEDDDADADADETPPARRPRWLVPAALAASVLVAVGVGVTMFGGGSSEPDADSSNPLGSMFAKRARARSEAEKAAAQAAADQEAEVVELAPLPPPPVFEAEGPQIEDLDTAIALIRKELVLANQLAFQDLSRTAAAEATADGLPAAPPAGAVALVPAPGTEVAATAGVVQPRDRRLTKILELYDGGNPDLAAASLEIFLRDFEDDPISQRILEAQPKVTDAAVE